MPRIGQFFANRGRFPDDTRAQLAAEGLQLIEEGLSGSITYRHFRAPSQRSSLRKQATAGSVALTTRRMVVWAGQGKFIDLPLTDPRRGAVMVTSDGKDRVCFQVDPSVFDPAKSGQIELRLRTAQAARIVALFAGSTR